MPQVQQLNVDYSSLSRDYAGQWVALDPESGRVWAAGASATEVFERSRDQGIESPFVTFVVDDYGVFAPWLR
jgi:hypothetical protein